MCACVRAFVFCVKEVVLWSESCDCGYFEGLLTLLPHVHLVKCKEVPWAVCPLSWTHFWPKSLLLEVCHYFIFRGLASSFHGINSDLLKLLWENTQVQFSAVQIESIHSLQTEYSLLNQPDLLLSAAPRYIRADNSSQLLQHHVSLFIIIRRRWSGSWPFSLRVFVTPGYLVTRVFKCVSPMKLQLLTVQVT